TRNCGHNILAGSNLKGYNNLEFSSGSPGANDVDVDPDFVDATRNILTWDSSLSGPGPVSTAMTELRYSNERCGYNTDYNFTDLYNYVRNGFKPQAAALQGTAHDAGDIGAMPVQVADAYAVSTTPSVEQAATGVSGVVGTITQTFPIPAIPSPPAI